MDHPAIAAFAILIQARLPVYGWGSPGIGKTSVAQAIAAFFGNRCWVVILSLREPSDQAGLPVIFRDADGTQHFELVPPRYARELLAAGGGVILWDEMNTAPVPVQNSALRVINEGWMGDTFLGENVAHAGLGNPPKYSPGAANLLPTMANRFAHIDWPFVVGTWCDGMRSSSWPAPNVPKVPKLWEEHVPSKRALIGEFIRNRPDLADSFPDKLTEQCRAWGSPRSWERLAFALAASEAAGFGIKSEIATVLMHAWVGDGNAIELKTWAVNQDLPDPEAVLADPKKHPLKMRQDQLMATLAAVATAAIQPHGQLKHRYAAAWQLVARVGDENGEIKRPDIVIPAARILAHHCPPGADLNPPREVDAILPILARAGVATG